VADDLEQPFLAAILANNDDADARAVYADWLEQRGDPRAEYLRLEANMYVDPTRFIELMQQLDPQWLAVVTRRCDVVLVETGRTLIPLIRTIRELTGYGLKEAKDLVDAPKPAKVRSDLPYVEALEAAARLDATGARAALLPRVR